MSYAARLQEAVEKVCPVAGVSIGKVGQPETVRFSFGAAAAQAQQEAAQKVLWDFDWSEAAQRRWDQIQEIEAFFAQDSFLLRLAGALLEEPVNLEHLKKKLLEKIP